MSPYNKLFTKTAFAQVPGIGGQDGLGDEAVAHVKICCIKTGTRWYVFEYDRETGRAYCWCKRTDGDGSFGFSVINEVNPGDYAPEDRGGIMQCVNDRSRVPPFERESHFSPITIAKIREKFDNGKVA